VILAAGEGRRYQGETHKLLAKVNGQPLVAWAIEHARLADFDETIVISGAVDLARVVPDDVTLLLNHDWEDGQARSLQVAVEWAVVAGHDTIVVGLGDQPMIPPEAWRLVAASESPIAVADFNGHQTPPVKLSQDVWSMLPIDGDEGARTLIRGRAELVEAITCDGHPIDVDTLTDLQRVQSRARVEGLGTWT